jgi:Mlc titration factor MtfA (ptsG expression regulator)
MLSRVIAAPFLVMTIAFLYLAWEEDTAYAQWMVPPVLILAVIYALHPQIDWWWYKRNPPELDPPIRRMLERFIPFYRRLLPDQQLRFRQRVALYMFAKDFKPMAMESVPEDAKAVIAINAIQLTFGMEDYLMGDYENFVLYPHPFPSPQYPKHFHHSETFHEDRVLLYSLELLLPGTLQSQQYYNIGMHELAGVFMNSFPARIVPDIREEHWAQIEQISGATRERITEHIGLPHVNVQQVAIVCFFNFPDKFNLLWPEMYEKLSTYFNVDPLGRVKGEG